MPDVTLTFSDGEMAALQAKTTDHNNRFDQKLTVAEWLRFHTREVLIADFLPDEIERLQRQYDRDLQAAIRAKKSELMDALAVDVAPAPIVP